MDVILHGYHVNQQTWLYLSLLLAIAVYFRFSRVWSLRNLDLLLLLAASPGLLLVQEDRTRTFGFIWLFSVTALYLVRAIFDPFLTRRPRLEQNLNAAGLTFLGTAAFLFISVRAVTETLPVETEQTLERAELLLKRSDGSALQTEPVGTGPAAPLVAAPVELLFENIAARTMAILCHLGVIVGLLFAGSRLFGDAKLGVAMATLYLLLPATSYDVGEVNHVLPSALIVWAIVSYRRPMVAGTLMGLACGVLFFPIFLLPLWMAFYGRHGAIRFGLALVIVGAVLLASLAFTSADPDSFTRQTLGTIRLTMLVFESPDNAVGFWSESSYLSAYRIPVIVSFLIMLIVLTIWPRRKTIEHLLPWSAAIVIGTQFWYPQQGGVYLLWYLPLLLMLVFRPRLIRLLPPQAAGTSTQPARVPMEPRSSVTNSAVLY